MASVRTITRTVIEIDEVTVAFDPARQRFEISNRETQERITLNDWQALRVKRALAFMNPGGFGADADD